MFVKVGLRQLKVVSLSTREFMVKQKKKNPQQNVSLLYYVLKDALQANAAEADKSSLNIE